MGSEQGTWAVHWWQWEGVHGAAVPPRRVRGTRGAPCPRDARGARVGHRAAEIAQFLGNYTAHLPIVIAVFVEGPTTKERFHSCRTERVAQRNVDAGEARVWHACARRRARVPGTHKYEVFHYPSPALARASCPCCSHGHHPSPALARSPLCTARFQTRRRALSPLCRARLRARAPLRRLLIESAGYVTLSFRTR